jgi:hypothetical protein
MELHELAANGQAFSYGSRRYVTMLNNLLNTLNNLLNTLSNLVNTLGQG